MLIVNKWIIYIKKTTTKESKRNNSEDKDWVGSDGQGPAAFFYCEL